MFGERKTLHNNIGSLKYSSDGGIMVWACFATSGPGWFAIIVKKKYS